MPRVLYQVVLPSPPVISGGGRGVGGFRGSLAVDLHHRGHVFGDFFRSVDLENFRLPPSGRYARRQDRSVSSLRKNALGDACVVEKKKKRFEEGLRVQMDGSFARVDG